MVGHVEAVEAGPRIVQHRRGRGLRIKRPPTALHIGDLPEADHDVADLKIRRERDARRNSRHALLPADAAA